MPEQLAPDVYGVMGAVNLYVVDDAESGVTVIDAGLPGTTRRVVELLQQIGRSPKDVRHILITHTDIDHVGDLKALVNMTGARVYASAESQTYLRRRRIPPHLHFPTKYVAGTVAFFVLRVVQVDQVVAEGDVLPIAGGIRVLATPGHTPDHVSYFWEREQLLFAGDLFRNETGELDFMRKTSTHDSGTLQRSADRVRALKPAIVCPGHGSVWTA
jgi:glyoxylase-like metal-dependent hydrolase (beta-lactamase superfamily II)